MGFDAVHMNLHKTFTTPHGGGGPGSGPVGVKADLVPFLPRPTVERQDGRFFLDDDRPQSIGRVRSFYGNFGMLVRAFTYLLAMGSDGLTQASKDAVLAANYLRKRLQGVLDLPHEGPCMHEFVASARNLSPNGIKALDLAKGLLERGFYAPTVYFPLIVPEAVMIEPTETESKATMDAFADALREIVELARTDPEELHAEPRSLPVGRLDEVRAARNPVLRWQPPGHQPVAGEANGGGPTHPAEDGSRRQRTGRAREEVAPDDPAAATTTDGAGGDAAPKASGTRAGGG
jgi:glycine dehydrogenase subunit 2